MSLRYLTKRTAINAGTKNPALTNFNHLRNLPRAWLVRRSKHDPKLKSVRPADRIKYWNIVPGDQVRLRGDNENAIHEVLSINRLSNRVFVKGTAGQTGKDGQPPQSKNYHYSRCQLYVGEHPVQLREDPTGPLENQPVFASRISTSSPVWNNLVKRFMWRRYAVSTIPRLPDWYRGKRLRIPWPAPEKRTLPEAGLYDTPRDEVARITYQPPTFEPTTVGAVPNPPSETIYLDHIYNPQREVSYNESLPFEIYLERELANPHSRAKKLERYHTYQASVQLLLKRIAADELRNLDGRTVRQAKADAAFKWREQVKEEQQKKKKARWLHSAKVASLERKAVKKTKKEERQRRRLTELVLKEEPNQVLPIRL